MLSVTNNPHFAELCGIIIIHLMLYVVPLFMLTVVWQRHDVIRPSHLAKRQSLSFHHLNKLPPSQLAITLLTGQSDKRFNQLMLPLLCWTNDIRPTDFRPNDVASWRLKQTCWKCSNPRFGRRGGRWRGCRKRRVQSQSVVQPGVNVIKLFLRRE
jgi:hypothetical protein